MAAPMQSLVTRLKLYRYSPRCTKIFSRTAADGATENDIVENGDNDIKNARRKKSVMQAETDSATSPEFRTFEVDRQPLLGPDRRRRHGGQARVPRFMKMKTDQDWTAVWPAAHTFKWSVVPFPVRQGAIKVRSEGPGDGSPPPKYANAELMKIPNFLHLTPQHIKKHCQAIKKFCTPWPKGLETDADCKKHFPLTVITNDYCFSSPNIRDPRARVVTLKFKLSDLGLDYHAKDKFLRLVGNRYDKNTGMVTITTDRCPMKKQNYDYAMYLLTVLYFESWKREPWEDEKTVEDMEKYFWDLNPSKQNVVSVLQTIKEIDKVNKDVPEEKRLSYLPEEINEDKIDELEPVKQYKKSVENLVNVGENDQTLSDYKRSVMDLLNIRVKQKAS